MKAKTLIDSINSRRSPLPFNVNPDGYHSQYIISPYHYGNPQNKPHYVVITNWIMRNLPKDASILEVGCGAGLYGAWLKNLGYENYFAVDINKLLIQVGKSATDLSLLVAGGKQLPFKDNSIDFVGYMNSFFDFDAPFFVQEALRVAKTWAEFDGLDAEYLLQTGQGTYGYKYLPSRQEILGWLKGHEIVMDMQPAPHRHLYMVKVKQ